MPNKAKKIKGVYGWAIKDDIGGLGGQFSFVDIFETKELADAYFPNARKIKVKIIPCK